MNDAKCLLVECGKTGESRCCCCCEEFEICRCRCMSNPQECDWAKIEGSEKNEH